MEFGDKTTLTLTPPANAGAGAKFDANDAQVLPGAVDDEQPLVQPGAMDDGFLDLKIDTDSVGPQIQPSLFDDLSGLNGADTDAGSVAGAFGFAGGGSDAGGGDAFGMWGLDTDIQRALNDHASRLDHMRGTAHVSDLWG